MLPTDLAILSSPIWSIPLCIQIRASSAPRARARLGRLVLVVGEDEVVAAAVDLEADAEQLLGHRRALDVPARAARGPRAQATRCPRRACAPSRARSRAGPPCASAPSIALALVHLVDVAVRERRRSPGRCARGSRRRRRPRRRGRASSSASMSATIGPIVSRGQRLVVGAPEPEAVGVGEVGRRHLARELARWARPSARARVVDLVVDVGDVVDERRAVGPRAQEPREQEKTHERPRVADVDAVVDRRPAGVDADLPSPAGGRSSGRRANRRSACRAAGSTGPRPRTLRSGTV